MTDMQGSQDAASGVKALIDRLRHEGVASGRAEADRLISEAKAQAQQIVADAEKKAGQLVDQAQKETEALKSAGQDALEVAARDAVLRLRSQLESRLSDQVRRLMSEALRDDDLLRRMILEVAGRARAEANLDAEAKVEVALPANVVGIDELRRRPEELEEGTLTHFVVAVAGEMLREGIEFTSAPGFNGIKLRLIDSEIEIDLDDEAIAGIILQHLQPRFRAVMEGIVR